MKLAINYLLRAVCLLAYALALAKLAGLVPEGSFDRVTTVALVLMLAGCVQPAMMPNINTATARVLDAVGIQTVIAPKAGCCGAVKFHLNDQAGGMAEMRANIDAWWPMVDAGGVEAIFTVLALRDQIVPPTLNLINPDEAADGLDLVGLSARPMPIQYALSNGFGFGGVNASLLFRRWQSQP